jgi:four helix bundle protein
MGYQDIEESRLYQRAEQVADGIWGAVVGWEWFAKDTVGKQLIRAVDSIGANIAESSGRYHPGDVVRFLHYARGSIKETRYWLRRALARQLISRADHDLSFEMLDQLGRELNAYINFQQSRVVKEDSAEYNI